MRLRTVLLASLAVSAPAAAQRSELRAETAPVPEVPAPTPAPAAVAQDAPTPPPDQASGIVVEDDTQGSNLPARAALFVPRALYWTLMQPIRGTLYVFERYDLRERFIDATFTDDRKLGMYPVATYQTTFGFTVGARVLYKDILGDGERLRLRADYGGEFAYAVGGKLTTGRRLGRLRLEADSSLEQRPRDHFYGIGNGGESEPSSGLIDPMTSSDSLDGRFKDRVVRHVATADLRITDEVHSRLSGAWMKRSFAPSDDMPVEDRYDTSHLIGYMTGVNALYGEEELIYDTRRPTSPYASQTLDATGWLLRGHVGLARGVDADPSRFYTYGGEVQRYFDLYNGTHTLTLRTVLDGVAGTDGRTDGKISFVDLPRLGGSDDLRGYPAGRFRDKIVTLATAEYTWAVDNNASAYTFFDAGKPLASLDEAADGRLRFGYGGGIQLHTKHTFFLRLQYGRSRDGDSLFNVVFSPAFGRRERVGKY